MPQMSPILWLWLFIIFTIVFILFNVMTYFNFLYKFNKSNNIEENNSNKTNQLTWKW
uniref:ATP synthase F0 subunit 8 n=1 Tax=Psychoda alternata TaxID=114594 RepID=UPI0022DCDFC8|nr:ATP synthase F0 subunit 8 [Psychoda alternata]AQX36169.1 ATP synthase F0 subunit 8 [Psychoda alternata]